MRMIFYILRVLDRGWELAMVRFRIFRSSNPSPHVKSLHWLALRHKGWFLGCGSKLEGKGVIVCMSVSDNTNSIVLKISVFIFGLSN